MKKLAKWLSEHFIVLGDGGKDTTLHLWCILLAFVSMTVFGILGIKGKPFEILCAVLYLGGTILPPIIAGIIALIKKQTWNPWYWFPIVIGFVIGGFFAIIVGLIFGWCSLW